MVKHVEYEGEKYPVRVGLSVCYEVMEETGLEIKDFDKLATDFKLQQCVFKYALAYGHLIEGKEPPSDLIVRLIFDERYSEVCQIIVDFFQSIQKQLDGANKNESLKKKTERNKAMKVKTKSQSNTSVASP